MLRFLAALSLALVIAALTVHSDELPNRQAIPLALVQADMLASAKHPSNNDKSNSTNNATLTDSQNATKVASAQATLSKAVNLFNPSIATNQHEAVSQMDQGNSHYDTDTSQATVTESDNSVPASDQEDFEEYARSNHSQEILVGPLKSLPEHPNGNGPQDMRLKGPGGYKRNAVSSKPSGRSQRTINRFKREFDDDDDDDVKVIVLNKRKLKSSRRKHRSRKDKKGVKRDGIFGMPYIPKRYHSNLPGMIAEPFDESQVMDEEMSSIPSSEPVGMASKFEPTNYDPINDASRSGFVPDSIMRSPAPNPLRLQELYERSSSWEPIGASSRFSSADEFNLGLPDPNYERSIEDDAKSVDDRFVSNYFNQERRGSNFRNREPNKRSEDPSILDSLGIGQSEIDEKYLTEARNIQDYLTHNEESAANNLGHNIRQHNSIQISSSPELMHETPNVWNMMDSGTYTPMAQEADSLLPNSHGNEQVLQSQNSMGRVFVPMQINRVAQAVQQEIASHYTLPKAAPLSNVDKAVANYPSIVRSFYPNVPYQTVSGASLRPPSMPNWNYRSSIQQQPQDGPPLQPMPMMLPFGPMAGNGFQDMMAGRQPSWGPFQLPVFGGAFPMPLNSPMPEDPGNSQQTTRRTDEPNSGPNSGPRGPGMLTVSSSDDDEEAKHEQAKSADFEELIPKKSHDSVQRVNVQRRPKNDTVGYLREAVPSDVVSMKTAIKEVLDSAVGAGNITTDQSKAISQELTGALLAKEKSKPTANATGKPSTPEAKGALEKIQSLKSNVAHAHCSDTIPGCTRFKDAGICPFVATFMNGACAKTCDSCAPKTKSRIQQYLESKKDGSLTQQEPYMPSMYLDFESVSNRSVVKDMSGNTNDAVLLKGAKISGRKLGTCGTGAEINDGDITWEGKTFHKKPVDAVTLAMWVKVHKGGTVNWFASGDKGTTFYTSTKDATIPSKIWTHVAGTYDSTTGLSSIYINGQLIKQSKQEKGQKLVQDWLVNGIGRSFGDDSMHYVDELYIFDRAIKPAEVKALYNKCTFNRMVIHYGFQKGNNSLILDQSGLQNDAIPIEGAVQKENCERCGYCLDLTHGLNPTLKIERISMSHIPTRSVSIALWVSMNSTKGMHDLFITQGPLDGSGYRLRVIDGKIRWSVGTDNGETIFDYETKSIVIPETLWTHIIATYEKESGEVSIFVNGVSKFKDTVDKKQRKLLPRDWETEAKLGDKSFNGYMDEFIMYNWAIDASEATYVRKYCADHPKLVRFIVHVPLTKRSRVTRLSKSTSDRSSGPDGAPKVN